MARSLGGFTPDDEDFAGGGGGFDPIERMFGDALRTNTASLARHRDRDEIIASEFAKRPTDWRKVPDRELDRERDSTWYKRDYDEETPPIVMWDRMRRMANDNEMMKEVIRLLIARVEKLERGMGAPPPAPSSIRRGR
jgi:hypothetical protein